MFKLTLQIIALHLAALFVASVIATVALAQEDPFEGCTELGAAAQNLAEGYGESIMFVGDVSEPGLGMVIFVNPVDKTWTAGWVEADVENQIIWFCGFAEGHDYILSQEVNLSPDA